MLIAQMSLGLLLFLLPLLGGNSGEFPLVVMGTLVAAGWLGWAMAKPRPALRPFPLAWPCGALLLATIICTATSVYLPASLYACYDLLIVVAGAWLFFALPHDRRQLGYGLLAFSAGVLVGELNGLYGWLTWYQGMHLTNWRVQSTWENPNFYAAFLLLCLPVLAMWARHAERRADRWLLGATVGLGTVALVLSQSRGALLAFLVMCCFLGPAWLWVEGKLAARTIGLLGVGVVLFIGLALVSPVGKRLLNPTLRAKQLHSQMFRFYTWEGAWRMTKAHPWHGSGPNAFLSAYGQYQIAGYTRQAHSIYLQQAAEMGVPGLLALLWLFGAIAAVGIGGLRAPGTGTEASLRRGMAVALLAACLGLLVHGFFDAFWGYAGIQGALLLAAALVGQLAGRAARPAPAWLAVALPLGVAVLVLLVWPSARARQLIDEAGQVNDDFGQPKKPEARAVMYRQAIAIDPANVVALRAAAGLVPAEEARGYLDRACALEPTNAANWLDLGDWYYYRQKDWPHARAAYATAVARQANYFEALFGLARVNWKLGDMTAARAGLQAIFNTVGTPIDVYHPVEVPAPWYTRSWYAGGILLEQQGHSAEAIVDFLHAIDAEAAYQAESATDEAKAVRGDDQGELREMQGIASLAHEHLARLLRASDPAAAARHRAAVDATLKIPPAMHNVPFF